jgi:hypothetical protein
MIAKGTTEKIPQFIKLQMSVYLKHLCFIDKNVFLNTTERLKQNIYFKLSLKICSVYIFRGVIY